MSETTRPIQDPKKWNASFFGPDNITIRCYASTNLGKNCYGELREVDVSTSPIKSAMDIWITQEGLDIENGVCPAVRNFVRSVCLDGTIVLPGISREELHTLVFFSRLKNNNNGLTDITRAQRELFDSPARRVSCPSYYARNAFIKASGLKP